jgi:hypothetical protein
MLVNTTTDVVRVMSLWVRWADAGLARSAALNAARSMDAERGRVLDDARTLRDLARIPAAAPAAEIAPRHASN